MSFLKSQAQKACLRSEPNGEQNPEISVYLDFFFKLSEGPGNNVRLCCSPLPLASAISGVCPKAREQAQGRGEAGRLRSGPDAKQTSRQPLEKLHRALFEKPEPGLRPRRLLRHWEVSKLHRGARGPSGVPVLSPAAPALNPHKARLTFLGEQ